MYDTVPDLPRCDWAYSGAKSDGALNPLYTHYHDTEWGRPVWDDKLLFSKLILDGQQAGLAWITILRKRATMLTAYDNFDPDVVAHYNDDKIEELLGNKGVIRSKNKILATIHNAQKFIEMRETGEGFSDYLWSFVNGKPIQNSWESMEQVPVKTPISEALSKDLKKRGFKYVGPVIIYAFMQAVGMVNDHLIGCHCYEEIKALGLNL